MKMRFLVMVTATFTLSACGSTEAEEPAKTPAAIQPQPLQPQPLPSKRSTVVDGNRIKGKVVDTMNAKGYTYVAVEVSPGKIIWAAGPFAPVKVGDALDLEKGHVMNGFTSESLGKTFETIYFVASLGVKQAPGRQPSSRPASAPTSRPTSAPAKRTAVKAPTEPIVVEKLPDGHTVADLFAKANELAGQNIRVRGQVVKFSGGIMGKNWIHIQDGSGDVAAKTHDLTVTTDAKASVGDTVIIKGILTRDKNFGAGYRYPVIVENAVIE